MSCIDDPKIGQKLAFLGYWHKCIHGTPIHLILKFGAGSCITCQVATIGSILKFESKWLMSGRAPCIASILNHPDHRIIFDENGWIPIEYLDAVIDQLTKKVTAMHIQRCFYNVWKETILLYQRVPRKLWRYFATLMSFVTLQGVQVCMSSSSEDTLPKICKSYINRKQVIVITTI